MLEDETKLREDADQVVMDMITAGVAQEKLYTDQRVGKEYPILITPGAFDKELIAVAVLGYPEQVGIWSYTLLRQGRVDESSMESYFRRFAEHDIGLVAINPNFFAPDDEGTTFIYQLDRVTAEISNDKRIGLIGFSMGGKILVEFLQQRPELHTRVAGLVLIDPTLPNRLEVGNIRNLLDNNTLLIASQSDMHSPGDIASVLLEIPKLSFEGIHGQMPSKALEDIIAFFRKLSDPDAPQQK
jgi:pimeloyl-ACP methyl ester carboxylesterase